MNNMIVMIIAILQAPPTTIIEHNFDPWGNWTPVHIINWWAYNIIPVSFLLLALAASGLLLYKFFKRIL